MLLDGSSLLPLRNLLLLLLLDGSDLLLLRYLSLLLLLDGSLLRKGLILLPLR